MPDSAIPSRNRVVAGYPSHLYIFVVGVQQEYLLYIAYITICHTLELLGKNNSQLLFVHAAQQNHIV